MIMTMMMTILKIQQVLSLSVMAFNM
jgi:hypothetical protein